MDSSIGHLKDVAGDCTYHGGVTVHLREALDMFNLLEANPRAWNHRLRVILAAYIIHQIQEGNVDARAEGGFTYRTERR
jgi:hypothetical protein